MFSMRRLTFRSGLIFLAVALSFLAISSGVGPSAALAQERLQFVVGVEDLPLMPGLSVNEDTGVVFDTPEGRIVRVAASGRVKRAAVEDFYAATLPSPSWGAGASAIRISGW